MALPASAAAFRSAGAVSATPQPRRPHVRFCRQAFAVSVSRDRTLKLWNCAPLVDLGDMSLRFGVPCLSVGGVFYCAGSDDAAVTSSVKRKGKAKHNMLSPADIVSTLPASTMLA